MHRRRPPGYVAHTLRAHHWHHPEQPQGYDPLGVASAPPPAQGVGALPAAAEDAEDEHEEEHADAEDADVIVLNNNQYSARVKQMSAGEFLRSDGALPQMVRVALNARGNTVTVT